MEEDNLEANKEVPNIVHRENVKDDGIPKIGMTVANETEAYNLYNEYAIRTGFSIRKGKKAYNTVGVLRHRTFVCSKEGLQEFDDLKVKKVERLETRTNCKAHIRFTVKDGLWEVTHFDPCHNHEFANPEQRKFLRSYRNFSKENSNCITAITSAVKARSKTVQAYSVLAKEVGGVDNVGMTTRYCHNAVQTERLNLIEGGDAQSVINHFKHKQANDPMFFYTWQVDDEGRPANFFWRDGRARIDYDSFADVVVFDTTFRTSKYDMICAPFVGVNHHRKNIFFGCALLTDETIPSFVWLFESFLESMGNRHPKTIFTDQCAAIANAIQKVLPTTCHRLCIWHIDLNAAKRLSSLYVNFEFKKIFHSCLYERTSEEEFEATWATMIEKFNQKDNEWLNTLYGLREKWCLSLNRGIFTANMRSSQRSESAKSVFHGMTSKTMNLNKFIQWYEDAIERARSIELEDDYRCSQGMPVRVSKESGMLKHAADTYTIDMFRYFQEELIESITIMIHETERIGVLHTYKVAGENNMREEVVVFNSDNHSIECSCKMYEIMGILCRHELRVLNLQNVTKIPNNYILKRWTKNAKKGVVTPIQDETLFGSNKTCSSFEWNRVMHKAYTIMHNGLQLDGGIKIADTLLDKMQEEFERLKVSNTTEVPELNINCERQVTVEHRQVLDPLRVRMKGVTNARMTNVLEKKRKRAYSKKNVPSDRGRQKSSEVSPLSLSQPLDPLHVPPSQFSSTFHQTQSSMESNPTILSSLHQDPFSLSNSDHPNFRFPVVLEDFLDPLQERSH